MSDLGPLARPTFGRARRREAYRRLADLVRRRRSERPLLDLEEVRRRLRVFEQNYLGLGGVKSMCSEAPNVGCTVSFHAFPSS